MELNKNIFTGLCCIIFSAAMHAQVISPMVKYWVTFSDKNGTAYSTSAPEAFLSQKSIHRRKVQNIAVDATDLPVPASYIQQVEMVNHVKVLYASKWLNGVVVAIDSAMVAQAALNEIGNFSFVQATKKVKRYRLTGVEDQLASGAEFSAHRPAKANEYSYGGSQIQNSQMGVQCLHNRGYRGNGITIAVCDLGFYSVETNPVFDSLNHRGGIRGTFNFVDNVKDVYATGEHGTQVLSCLAGNIPGTVLGSAPMADYWLFKTEEGESETISEEYNWVRAAEFSDSVGVDIMTTSLGYTDFDDPGQSHTYQNLDGKTAPMSIAATMAAHKGMFICTAAGNEGERSWHFIGVPADAADICTVGAVDTLGSYASFSSVGPTADNRIKPDLVACGSRAWVCGLIGTCYRGDGTSYATPILAGGVACYWQANPSLGSIALLQKLKSNASNAASPNNNIGWGLPNLCMPDQDFDFTVFSDPPNNQIVIDLNWSTYEFITVEIVDLLGHILLSTDISKYASRIRLNDGGLASAIYLVKVKTSKGTKTKRILKQN
jgi:subtilisin family serine protease